MSDINAEVGYLAIGANRQTDVADWSQDGIVAFGAGVNIALWRPQVTRRSPYIILVPC